MSIIASQTGTDDATAASYDITLDVGTGAGRKAIILCGRGGSSNTGAHTVTRDPTGAAEACTRVTGASGNNNNGSRNYVVDIFYLDLSVTGSQTFRITSPETNALKRAWVGVDDGLASGAPEASNVASAGAGSVTAIPGSITTLTNNAVVYQVVQADSLSTVTFTPANSQTELFDVADWFPHCSDTLTVATAGATTVGVTASANVNGYINGMAAWAPAGGGGGGNTVTATLSDDPAGFTEAFQRDLNLTRLLADSKTFSDAITTSFVRETTRILTDSFSPADAINFVVELGRTVTTGSGGISDALARDAIFTRLLADTFSFDDSPSAATSAQTEIVATLADSFSFDDAFTRDGTFTRALLDNLPLSESLQILVNDAPLDTGLHWRYWLWRILRRQGNDLSEPYQR